MKTIGIVAEGPRDFELIAAVIDTITNEENSYQMIQPEPDMAGRFGNGWKGVWKWCETNQGSLNTYMNSLTPVLDFLVIHNYLRDYEMFTALVERVSEGIFGFSSEEAYQRELNKEKHQSKKRKKFGRR